MAWTFSGMTARLQRVPAAYLRAAGVPTSRTCTSSGRPPICTMAALLLKSLARLRRTATAASFRAGLPFCRRSITASRPPTLAIATCTSGTAETLFSAQAAPFFAAVLPVLSRRSRGLRPPAVAMRIRASGVAASCQIVPAQCALRLGVPSSSSLMSFVRPASGATSIAWQSGSWARLCSACAALSFTCSTPLSRRETSGPRAPAATMRALS
mmetsp:Transcript_22648/g.67426  ORF Transcript_22648/g.67426 Transcript_22648/m.67426 type:complete len:212 (-) Transcript_22648:372-1007(-)